MWPISVKFLLNGENRCGSAPAYPVYGRLTRDYIPCLGQRGKKPYPVQRQDRAISRVGCIRVRPGRLCFQKIISLQNQRITAEYQDWNWLAQVSIVQARDSWFSSDDVIVDQITPKLHKKTTERQRTTPVFTGIEVLLVLGVLLFQFYFQYNLFILRLEPPGTRLAQQAPTYGSL